MESTVSVHSKEKRQVIWSGGYLDPQRRKRFKGIITPSALEKKLGYYKVYTFFKYALLNTVCIIIFL